MCLSIHTTAKVEALDKATSAREKIQSAPWEDILPDVRCIDPKTMVFERAAGENVLFHNSFLPRIRLDFQEDAGGTYVVIHARLKQATQFFLNVFRLLALVLETALVFLYFTEGIEQRFVLLLPVLLAVYSDCLAYVCLKRSVKPFIKAIRRILQAD